MSTKKIVVLTEKQYINPSEGNAYIKNVLLEDKLVVDALIRKGHDAVKINWDHPTYDWSSVDLIIVRSIWDYHHRMNEFEQWLSKVTPHCKFINDIETIRWNIDKHYLRDMESQGVRIVPTQYIQKGDNRSLQSLLKEFGGNKAVLKPVVSAAARNTFKIEEHTIEKISDIFHKLIQEESMIIQPFINSIESKGELSMMVFGGTYSHTVLKKAKPGDFRVQDDFGGTVHEYEANAKEIKFAEDAVKACSTLPLYARVDIVWDDDNNLCLSELELIEPELWFRNRPEAADFLAELV